MDILLREACAKLEIIGRVQVLLKPVVYFAPTVFDSKLVDAVRSGALGTTPCLKVPTYELAALKHCFAVRQGSILGFPKRYLRVEDQRNRL